MKTIRSVLLCIFISMVFIMQTGVSAVAADIAANRGEIVLENNSSYSVDLVDHDRQNGKIIIYTRNYGEYTKPFGENTSEYVVVNNIIVSKNTMGTNGTYIPSNGFVISYTGSDNGFMGNLDTGTGLTLKNIDTAIPLMPDMYFRLNGIMVPIDLINSARGEKQTVLYNPSFGPSTKTNAWGMELTVVDSTVTKVMDLTNVKGIMVDNDSAIPENGVVISVHYSNPLYKQLHGKVKAGDSIEIQIDNAALYGAGKTDFAAYNPKSVQDNPLAWDAANNKPYDGYRGPNQLIIYDSSYGSRTGTNPYGFEVSVNGENKIVAAGGNNLEIPAGGYVISGHGEKSKWLKKYGVVGSKVVLDKERKNVALIYTPEAYIDIADYSIKYARDRFNLARSQYRDIPYGDILSLLYTADKKLEELRAQVVSGQFRGLAEKVNDIRNDASNAYYMTFEPTKAENRAIWLRPIKTGKSDIIKQLDMLKTANINMVYLETFWNGYSIYPTDNAVMPQNPIYNRLDVLDTYIKEAHKRGMELHAWVVDFLVNPAVAAKHPEWLVVSKQGHYYYLESGTTKYYHLNPALPKVRDYLSGLYKDMVKKYDLDGIQFDYMRYPRSGDYADDFSYDPYTRQLFKDYTGIDPIKLKPTDTLWQKWFDFRTELVSSFFYRIVAEVKSIKPDMQISADVRPDYDNTIADIYQDPRSWSVRGYINDIVPMAYYLDETPVTRDINSTWAFAKGHSQVVAGLASYTGVDKNVFLRQVDAVRASNTNGVAVFEFQSLFSGGYDRALKLGAFRTPAVVTHKEPEKAVSLLLKDIIRKIDDIYTDYGAMSEEQAERYKKLIADIKVDFVDAGYGKDKAELLNSELQALNDTVRNDDQINREVSDRISSDLCRAMNIVDAYISNSRFVTDHKVREFQMEIPLEALKQDKEAAVRIKAVFTDNSFMYLDSTQYSIASDNPAAAEADGDRLRIASGKGNAGITVRILDSFKFNTTTDVEKQIQVTVDTDGQDIIEQAALGSLKVAEAFGANVALDWSGAVSDSTVVGYSVYRDGIKIADVPGGIFVDRNLARDIQHIYEVYGFDLLGKVVYKSNKLEYSY